MKKQLIIIPLLLISVIISIFSCIYLIRNQKSTNLTQSTAIELVNTKLKTINPDSYLITSPCSVVISGEDDIYFKIEYHEKHNEDCPGDPQTFILLAMYRVNKKTRLIERYNIVEDKYQTLK